jgi:type IV pilus assembly protein PilA
VRRLFCSGCGHDVAVGERFCRVCGKEVSAESAQSPVLLPAAEGTIFPAQTSGKAIASLVCGFFLFAFPLSILAVIFGHLAVSEIRKSAGRLKGEGMAIAGLVLGYVGLAVIPVILIVAAVAIPNLLRARMAANESSAAGSVRQLVVAETAYAAAHPDGGFTCRLSDLASAGLIDSRLASGQRNGYAFELLDCSASLNGGANVKYGVTAYPLQPYQTGTRSFCSDESAVLRVDVTGSRDRCRMNGTDLH